MFRTVCMKYSNGDYDLANDYCQLGYVKVHKNLHTFKGEGSIEGWVRRVLITTIINEIRLKKQKKYIDTTTDYDFERTDLADEPEENIEDMYVNPEEEDRTAEIAEGTITAAESQAIKAEYTAALEKNLEVAKAADAILFLSSSLATYVTGTSINLDGGLSGVLHAGIAAEELDHRRVGAPQRAQARIVEGIGQHSHIEYQVCVQWQAVLEGKRFKHQGQLRRGSAHQGFHIGLQLRGTQQAGVDHVGAFAQFRDSAVQREATEFLECLQRCQRPAALQLFQDVTNRDGAGELIGEQDALHTELTRYAYLLHGGECNAPSTIG